jgi:hypothetical protein
MARLHLAQPDAFSFGLTHNEPGVNPLEELDLQEGCSENFEEDPGQPPETV